MSSPTAVIDLARYPVLALASPRGRELIETAHAELGRRGMAVLPGFLRADALPALVAECDALAKLGHFSEVHGTPYIDVPDLSLPEGHPPTTASRRPARCAPSTSGSRCSSSCRGCSAASACSATRTRSGR
jgi:hypothetical protein